MRTLLSVLAILALATPIVAEEPAVNEAKPKTAVMIIANQNFRDEEFAEPYALLTAAGVKVSVAAARKAPAQGMLGKTVTPDLALKDVDPAHYDAVIFVGGAGAQVYFNDPDAHRIAKSAVDQGKLLAAICVAPATLANAGVLKGRKATCFPSVERLLTQGGATVVHQNVVIDGRIITAPGPQAAGPFGQALVKALQ